MTLSATQTTWITASAFDAYVEYMGRCEAVAEAVGFDFNSMIGAFYNAAGQRTSEFAVGQSAYYAGLHRDELTSHEMKMGFDDSHGEMMFSQAMAEDSYENEPGYRSAWDWQ